MGVSFATVPYERPASLRLTAAVAAGDLVAAGGDGKGLGKTIRHGSGRPAGMFQVSCADVWPKCGVNEEEGDSQPLDIVSGKSPKEFGSSRSS